MMYSLTLDLSDDDILNKLKWEIRGVRKRGPITKLEIECINADYWVVATGGASFSDDDLQTIFTYIGHAFPYLQEIVMKIFQLPLPVSALNKLLQLSNETLQSLEMEDVILKGSQEELERLASTLHEHPALKKVHLDWCQPATRGTSLDPVFRKLSKIRTLTQVKICGGSGSVLSGSVLSVASLRVLCSNQSLKRLSLPNDTLPNDGLAAITEALESPAQHIRELSVRLCGLDASTGVRFANVLRNNRSVLQKLELRIKDSDWNAYVSAAFSQALRANHTLTDVSVYIDGTDTQIESTAQHLVTEALTHHKSLKSARIALRGVVGREQQRQQQHTIDLDDATTASSILTKPFLGRIRTMLQTNTCLEQLQIDGMADELKDQDVQFFLRANRAGRQKLLQNFAADSLWIEALVEQRHDVAFVHYFLSLNPGMLCPKTIIATTKVFEV